MIQVIQMSEETALLRYELLNPLYCLIISNKAQIDSLGIRNNRILFICCYKIGVYTSNIDSAQSSFPRKSLSSDSSLSILYIPVSNLMWIGSLAVNLIIDNMILASSHGNC